MGNEVLKYFAAGNHSFTGIVNHTRQDLRHGKDSHSSVENAQVESLESLSAVS